MTRLLNGWQRFSRSEPDSSKAKIELLKRSFVNCTIEAPVSYAEALKQVAQCSNAPVAIEHLPDLLEQRHYIRGVTAFGKPGEYFDRVAQQFENLHWTVTERGLRFWQRSPLDDLSSFDRLAGELTSTARIEAGGKNITSSTYLKIATRLDKAGFIPLKVLEESGRKALATYNQKHALRAIHTFTAGLQSKSPGIRTAILRRLYRASEKYKRIVA